MLSTNDINIVIFLGLMIMGMMILVLGDVSGTCSPEKALGMVAVGYVGIQFFAY